jgi:hypothetical protein
MARGLLPMDAIDIAHDTIPSPPESGEYTTLQIEVRPSDGVLAPRYVQRVVSELHAALAGLRCPEHGTAPALTADFGTEDFAVVDVVPHDCCSKLDELVLRVLRRSPIFRVTLLR